MSTRRRCSALKMITWSSAMNERGTVVFLAFRRGFLSQAIFAGSGGPLAPIVDTATDANFLELGNADINASGEIVFQGFLADGALSIFLSAGDIKDLIDTNDPSVNFLDPVINESGTVGAAFLNVGGVEVFTVTAAGITPRTNPLSTFFALVDNVSINNLGDVAFSATETVGIDGIFVELTGGTDAVPVIETGDPLFGSNVVALSIETFVMVSWLSRVGGQEVTRKNTTPCRRTLMPMTTPDRN